MTEKIDGKTCGDCIHFSNDPTAFNNDGYCSNFSLSGVIKTNANFTPFEALEFNGNQTKAILIKEDSTNSCIQVSPWKKDELALLQKLL